MCVWGTCFTFWFRVTHPRQPARRHTHLLVVLQHGLLFQKLLHQDLLLPLPLLVVFLRLLGEKHTRVFFQGNMRTSTPRFSPLEEKVLFFFLCRGTRGRRPHSPCRLSQSGRTRGKRRTGASSWRSPRRTSPLHRRRPFFFSQKQTDGLEELGGA